MENKILKFNVGRKKYSYDIKNNNLHVVDKSKFYYHHIYNKSLPKWMNKIIGLVLGENVK
ncbi:MAG: hypothetical protein LBD94_01775 [Rickettsiales bacterium]|jgi:hypothetical protein|nr:hypothetical protein [Rickettsiales bacterium]